MKAGITGRSTAGSRAVGAALKWAVAIAITCAAWSAVVTYLFHVERSQRVERQVSIVPYELPCSKPWMTVRDERAVCAMETAARDWAKANPGKVKR